MAADDNEQRFLEFTKLLLAVEEPVHRSGAVPLYTPEALQGILRKFCNIIASHLEAQSCTIQLKLHDIASCKFIATMTGDALLHERETGVVRTNHRTDAEIAQIERYRERIADEFRRTWKAAGGMEIALGRGPVKTETNRRNRVLRTSGTFPYCIYPKGAMWLAAANEESPWEPFVDWLITDLRAGLTAEIVQEKSPRRRDPFSIRKSRSFRKMGPVDPCLWTNLRPDTERPLSPRYFLNFYAVPIRIHSSGDVIGILKIENKGFSYDREIPTLHGALNDVLDVDCSRSCEALVDALHGKMRKAEEAATAAGFEQWTERGVEKCKRSILSLVVLAFDLSQCIQPEKPPKIEELLTVTYGDASLGGKVPPIQILFDKLEEEDAFFMGDGDPREGRPDRHVVRRFYETLNEEMEIRDLTLGVREQLRKIIQKELVDLRHRGASVSVESTAGRYPDFFYRVSAERNRQEIFHFHVQVCPRTGESGNVRLLTNYWGMSPERARKYRAALPKQAKPVELAGEYISGSDNIIHLRTDRVAGRIQALAYAFPVPPFVSEDARKLSWAALETGKLIERQISYRGTHGVPTVPLTADDFFRVPISDLSFVDAVRQQYENADVLRGSLLYHLPNLCTDLNFSWGIDHSQRVKGLRSYFDRIGQSHRAEYDAVIALWLYILSRKMTNVERRRISAARREVPLLLRELRQTIEEVWKEDRAQPKSHAKWKAELDTWLESRVIYPDLRFSAPALELPPRLRKEALRCLRHNLSRCPTGAANHDPRKPFTPRELTDLLFRRYDAFVTQATSLYLQLHNEDHRKGYVRFYRTTRGILERLRDRLEMLEEQVTRSPQGKTAIGRLSEIIGKLRVEVLLLSTRDLNELFGKDKPTDEELLRFSVQGIYKRIRTLANVSGNQCSPAQLNWENGRFDYLGARLTCLFKNQVFAAYEEVWRRGDPFLPKPQQKTQAARRGGSSSRQRWLCIRTRVHTGDRGYNAWQISALMDPFAISDSYWEDNSYTLNVLREILSAAHREWNGDVKRYQRIATQRDALQKQYSEWFSAATELLDTPPASRRKRGERLFGEYLGEWALDVLVHVLKDDRILTRNEIGTVLKILERFVAAAHEYSQMVLKMIRGEETRANYAPDGDQLIDAARMLYEWSEDLVELGRAKLSLKDKEDYARNLSRQKEIFLKGHRTATSPLVFVGESAKSEIAEIRSWIGKSERARKRGLIALEKILRRIQGGQMDYLFDIPDKRGQADVTDRILCYILLHRSSAYTHPSKSQWKAIRGAPDAYNLFYFVMSLLPVEIQIRTALADTMAEQYHRIYKIGSDALSEGQIQQRRLMEIGRDLESTDRIFEVQFEDYIAQKSI